MNKLHTTSIAFVLSQNIFAKEAPVENEQTRFELIETKKVIGTVGSIMLMILNFKRLLTKH